MRQNCGRFVRTYVRVYSCAAAANKGRCDRAGDQRAVNRDRLPLPHNNVRCFFVIEDLLRVTAGYRLGLG